MYTGYAKLCYVTSSAAKKRTKFIYLKEISRWENCIRGPSSMFATVRYGISELALRGKFMNFPIVRRRMKSPDTSTNPPTNRLELTFGKILQLSFGKLIRDLSNEVKGYNRC